MRRAATFLVLALSATGLAHAKFGMTKTKIMLHRLKPAELVVAAETVVVNVEGDGRRISDAQLGVVRDRVEQALQAGGTIRVVDDAKRADAVITIKLSGLAASTDETTEYETRYVKTGERQEWDSKKNKYVTKDQYGNKQVSVTHYKADGRLDVRVEVEPAPPGKRSADAVVEFQRDFKESDSVPDEARSESALEEWLIAEAGIAAAGKVAPSPDPVEAFLAVDKPLKLGNEMIQRGQFREALSSWEALRLKGDEEAARQHNMAVAHEGLAYALPLDAPEHREELDKAAEMYGKARSLDSGEKYFAPPLERIQASLQYAEAALRQSEERRTALTAARSRPTPAKGSVKPPSSAKPSTTAPARPGAVRNGTFDKVLAPWVLDGQGGLKGGAFEARGGSEPTLLSQALRADLGTRASLGLRYRVTSGEPRIRFTAVYEDAAGKSRTHAADVTAGDAPGGWTDWSSDLLAIRPKPARLTEIRFEVDGGVAEIDDVRLEVK